MPILRSLAAILVLTGSTVLAHADASDFKTHVLDPLSISYPTYVVTSTQFDVTFSACQSGELPGGITAQGCFAGVNRSGQDFTGLDFVFENVPALGSQPASCAPAASHNIYSNTSCGLDRQSNLYLLDFSGGVLSDGAFFFVTEDGVDPALFPTGVATAQTTVTPEPAPFLLLGSGLLLFGLVSTHRVT